MRNTNGVTSLRARASAFWAVFLLSLFMLYGCASQKPQLNASQYRFTINDEAYRIRSISSQDKAESYNELIGAEFVAADLDQDRTLDCILMGEMSLDEAQKIYEHGLALVTKENKLRIRMPNVDRYTHSADGVLIEITSFRPAHAPPFNEFRIVDNRPVVCQRLTIMVDQNADGTLDKVLKGSSALEEVQPQYAEVIAAGLQKGQLVTANGKILVKEK